MKADLGPLNIRCRIEQKSATQDDDFGTEVITWTLLGVAWCSLQDELPSKSESVRQGVALSALKTRVRMRYRTDIDPSMRLVIHRPDETVYQIVSAPAILGNKDGIEFVVEKYSS